MHVPFRAAALLCALCCGLLPSCGPAEIGAGSDTDRDTPGRDSFTEMRYPMSGSASRSRETYFYLLNREGGLEAAQRRQTDLARRWMGVDPEHPSYRETPRQASPFRE